MNIQIKIKDIAPKKVFWDVDINKLSTIEDNEFIIPRMLMATTEKTFNMDIATLEKVYTPNEIYSVLKNTKERISNQVCKMNAKRYDKAIFLRYKFH